MRTITVLLLALFATAAFGAPKGALENPQPNDYASGIYLFSGWVCEAETVQIGLDGVQLLDVAYGTDRLDTHEGCGEKGLVCQMANLGRGIALYAEANAQHLNAASGSLPSLRCASGGSHTIERFNGQLIKAFSYETPQIGIGSLDSVRAVILCTKRYDAAGENLKDNDGGTT